MAKLLKAMGASKYQADGDPRTSGPGFGVTLHPGVLDEPRRWRNPRVVFVNSMSDLFYARVSLDFVREVFAVIAATPRHSYWVIAGGESGPNYRPMDINWAREIHDLCQSNDVRFSALRS